MDKRKRSELEDDSLVSLRNIALKSIYFVGRFKPEVMFMRVYEVLKHMLNEVFDECLENMSELSARAPQTNN
jgi:hypothetical protein